MNDQRPEPDPTQPPESPTPGENEPSKSEPGDKTKAGVKKPREKKPEFFGPRGWLAVLLPFIIFLGGLNIGTYMDNARVHTALKESGNRSQRMMGQIMNVASADESLFQKMRDLGWPKIEKPELGETPEESLYTDLTNVALGEHYDFEEVQSHVEVAESIFDDEDARIKLNQMTAQFNAQESMKPGYDPKLHEVRTLSDWKEVNDFTMKLLQYEENHEQRPIIAEYFAKANEWAVEDGKEPKVNSNKWFPDDRSWYPTIYSLVIFFTTLSVLFAFPKYLRDPFRVTPLAIGVGVIGIFVWIALWWLDKKVFHLGAYFVGAREHFNPFEELKHNTTWMWTFLGIRLWGLVIIIPIVEEFFLRGWLMRYIDTPDWDEEPIGKLTRLSLAGIIVYSVATHPAEPLAALVWFGMITWLFWKTRSIWDCVVAHLVTNLLLAAFVLSTKTWELW